MPAESTIDVEDELSSWDGTSEDDSGSILPFLSQRQVLLFGMLNLHSGFYRLLLMHRR